MTVVKIEILSAGSSRSGQTQSYLLRSGVISPLLSNLVLDDLDPELERRGHRFVRYADDSNIYVGSERAGSG
jgi:RNA-directed DNA polymerase